MYLRVAPGFDADSRKGALLHRICPSGPPIAAEAVVAEGKRRGTFSMKSMRAIFQPEGRPFHPGYRPDIDGLRAVPAAARSGWGGLV